MTIERITKLVNKTSSHHEEDVMTRWINRILESSNSVIKRIIRVANPCEWVHIEKGLRDMYENGEFNSYSEFEDYLVINYDSGDDR